MKVIYEFRRPDGSLWSDYTLPEEAAAIRKIPIDTEAKILAAIEQQRGRMRALAIRALDEFRQEVRLPAAQKPGVWDRWKKWVK